MPFRSTKTYTHEIGLSCAFRQWRASSHCRFVHGYALSVRLEFEASRLDNNNWVMDFGSLKPIKAWLEEMFDHKLLVAEDDPNLAYFKTLENVGAARISLVPAIGCEAFAAMIYWHVHAWLRENGHAPRVRLAQVEVKEHGANSAIYIEET